MSRGQGATSVDTLPLPERAAAGQGQGQVGPSAPIKRPRLTDAQLKCALAEHLETVRTQIAGYVAYVDTVEILLMHPLTHDQSAKLRRLAIGEITYHRSKTGLFVARIQRPTLSCISYLTKLVPDHIVTRFDIAFDLLTHSSKQAQQVQNSILRHLTQPWRGHRKVTRYQTTIYYGAKRTRRNLAMYATRPSKLTGGPAAHIELRYSTAASCRRRRVNQLKDLVRLAPAQLLAKDCRLSIINWHKVDREIDKMASMYMLNYRQPLLAADRPEAVTRIREHLLDRIRDHDQIVSWSERNTVPVQIWIDAWPDIRRCLVHIPINTLIKGQLSLFWN
jgi:hypothetical protein